MIDFEKTKEEYKKISQKLSDPGLSLDRKEYGKLSKRLNFIQGAIDRIKEKEEIEKNIKENEEISEKGEDKDFKKLAEEENIKLKKEKENIEKEIEEILCKKKESENEVLMEIRAGAGGEEAALFAQKLFEMYQKFSQKKDWKLTVLACHLTNLKGFKEISLEIKGKGAGDLLKYESGVHRVQRIPETEKMGRIHTSTVSISVLEKPKEKEIEIKQQDLRIDVYRASGPGGQYVNRRDSAVRVTHIPTGLVSTSQSARTQISNRENAISILKARLFEAKKEEEEKKLGSERKSQVGKSMRAEKIRTYNFPQDRITDHRIKKSWGHIENILEGNLEEMIKTLKIQNI